MKKLLFLIVAALGLAVSSSNAQVVWDNFENPTTPTNPRVFYPAVATGQGTLSRGANPSRTGINTSAGVLNYDRSDATYDVIRISVHGTISDMSAYARGAASKFIKIKVYSPKAGLNVTMSIEDSNLATATNYPAGRYMQVKATTTVAHAWELLTFNVDCTPIAGNATQPDYITQFVLMVAPNYTAGPIQDIRTWAFDDFQLPETTNVVTPADPEIMLQNYEDVRLLNFASADGQMEWGVPNPHPDAVNSSPFCAHYTRNYNGQVQYDGFKVTFDGTMPAASMTGLVRGSKKLRIKIYAVYPGTRIDATFINQASIQGWPKGRHTVWWEPVGQLPAGQWVDLILTFHERPDADITDGMIDALTFQFNSSNPDRAEVYIDEIRGPNIIQPPILTSKEYLWDDFDQNRRICYTNPDGVMALSSNPTTTVDTANTSPNVLAYSRSTELTDYIWMNTGGAMMNLAKYMDGSARFSMKVFSYYPGNTVTIGVHDPGTVQAGKPLQVGTFVGFTNKVNQWENVIFSKNQLATPNAQVLARCNVASLQFAPGVRMTDNFVYDNLWGPRFAQNLAACNPVAGTAPEQTSVVFTVGPNPAADQLDVFLGNDADVKSLDLVDVQGRLMKSELPAKGSANKTTINVSGLTPGMYILKAIRNNGAELQQKVSIVQ
ncbi:MAG: T9SS type A sorting domain-containing protein [Bacteroidota bacterium]